jgi:hypothetical protein
MAMSKTRLMLTLALGGLACSAAPARANPAAAAQCRAGLPPEAALIYDAVLPQISPTSVIRDVMQQKVRAMVMAGQVKESSARDSATAAGACFRALRE